MKQIGILMFMLCLSTASFAQTKITGHVSDKNGEVLIGTKIILKPVNKKTITDLNGRFSFEVAEDGVYTIEVYGYNSLIEKRAVAITNQKEINTNFVLDKVIGIESVTVTGAQPQTVRRLETITRLPLDPQKGLQSISIIGEDIIDKQGITTVQEAVKNTVGVYTFASYGGRYESFGARGMRGAPVLKNGLDYGWMHTETQGVESVQVFKGATSITQGFVAGGRSTGGIGGTINIVTKTPQKENFGKASLRAGNWGRIRPTVDINRVLNENKTVAVRLNGAYENNDGYSGNNAMKRYYLNPSVGVQATEKLNIVADFELLDDSRAADPGTVNLSADNTQNLIYNMPTSQYLGFSEGNNDQNTANYSATANYQLTDIFSIRGMFSGMNTKQDGVATRVRQVRGTPNMVNRTLSPTGPSKTDVNLVQLDFIGQEIKTSNLTHLFQVGFDYKVNNSESGRFNSVEIDQIDILKPYTNDYSKELNFKQLSFTDSKETTSGIAAQYALEVGEKARVFAAGRYTSVDSESEGWTTDRATGDRKPTSSTANNSTLNPMIGAMFYPTKQVGIFATYTNTAIPESASRLDINGNTMGNQSYNQVELGAKTSLIDDKLIVNLTLYNIQNQNVLIEATQPDGNGVAQGLGYYVKGGDERRQGVEFETQGKLTPNIDVVAGYSYINAQHLKSSIFRDGSAVFNTPKHSGSTWFYYTQPKGNLKGLTLGSGLFYHGERPYNEEIPANKSSWHGIQPGLKPWMNKAYTTVNVQAGYTFVEKYNVRLFANNLFNAEGYDAYRNVFINRIDPFNISGQLSFNF